MHEENQLPNVQGLATILSNPLSLLSKCFEKAANDQGCVSRVQSVVLSLQSGDGVQLQNGVSDFIKLDTTPMNQCILIPTTCATGASYSFWVKFLSNEYGSFLTTTFQWAEGIRIPGSTTSLHAYVYRPGATNNYFATQVSGMSVALHTWVHMAVIWFVDPRVEIYLDGEQQSLIGDTAYRPLSATVGSNSLNQMFVGKNFVNSGSNAPDVIMDSITLCDRPLSAAEILITMS